MALITCRDLCLAYEGDPAVIENLNIEVNEGNKFFKSMKMSKRLE